MFTKPTSVPQEAFMYSTLRRMSVPSNMKSIGVRAFSDCTNLTQLTLPATTTSIAVQAFKNCTYMTQITILATTPPTLAAANAFDSDNRLASIYVPAASVSTYKSASIWSGFASKIKAIPE